ncbi:MAG: hypothetical protein KAS66_00225 [Candidatus Omnitrophica bacterium]|nr:hypothetical protein [Candidatus Omnitrophota bacterium]
MAPRFSCKVTVPKAKNPGTQINQTVLLVRQSFVSDILDADGNCAKDAGEDIRLWADAAFTIPMPRHVKKIIKNNNPALGTLQIYTLYASFPSGDDPECWATWGDPGATEPAPDSAFGQYNAYDSKCKGVWHFEESCNGTTDESKEATENQNHGTGGGGDSSKAPTLVDATIDKALDYDGTNDFLNCGTDSSLDINGENYVLRLIITPHTLAASGSSGQSVFLVKGEAFVGGYYIQHSTGGKFLFTSSAPTIDQTYAALNTLVVDETALWHVVREGSGSSNVTIYKNGVEVTYSSRGTHAAIASTSDPLEFGRYLHDTSQYHADAIIEQALVYIDGVFNANKCVTENNNLMDAANFAYPGPLVFLYNGRVNPIIID